MAAAIGHRIGRHVHPHARPGTAPTPPTPTGIDYLALVATGHRASLAKTINYTALSAKPGDRQSEPRVSADVQLPGQLSIPETGER